MKDEHWEMIALTKGFDSIADLLKSWYLELKKSQEEIADELGVHRSTIASLMARLGIDIRPRSTLVISRDEAVNLTTEQIARRYNVPRSTAWRAKRKAQS